MKRFGFHPDQLYFNLRNPQKVRYLTHKQLGDFEAPMKTKEKSLDKLYKNYQDRLEFEKYMNPKGLKPTITSRFKKPQQEIDFVSHTCEVSRGPKPYETNVVNFRVNPYLSKPEIKQYFGKLYNMPIKKVNTFRRMGKIQRDPMTNIKSKRNDFKKATLVLDYDVEPEFQKLQ